MKIEKLNNKKKIIIGVIVLIGIISIITIATSKAAYKSTQSIGIVNGTISIV